MPRSTSASSVYDDDGNDVIRFEESDDFSHYPSSPTLEQRPDAAAHGNHDVDLKRKQAELLQLRQELESKERETNRLEQRRQKEERFSKGRRNMCEQLSRTLVRLERELYNSQKAIEEISLARDTFERHLAILRDQQPELWERQTLDTELDLALAAMEDAEDEFARISRRLSAVVPHGGNTTGAAESSGVSGMLGLPEDFQACLRLGFAFTLPLAAILAFTLIAIKLLSH